MSPGGVSTPQRPRPHPPPCSVLTQRAEVDLLCDLGLLQQLLLRQRAVVVGAALLALGLHLALLDAQEGLPRVLRRRLPHVLPACSRGRGSGGASTAPRAVGCPAPAQGSQRVPACLHSLSPTSSWSSRGADFTSRAFWEPLLGVSAFLGRRLLMGS